MNWRISIIIIVLLFAGCKNESSKESIISKETVDTNENSYLIEIDALMKLINNPNIKIIDFRKTEIYLEGHIPGALNVWRTDIEDTSYPYNGMMASKKQIEILFGGLGIKTNDTLVIYDDNGLCDSSRLWWVLQNYDFTNVKLFHGGIKAWKFNNGNLSTEIPLVENTIFALPENPSMKYVVSKEEVLKAILKNTVILDTRTDDEYSGKRQKNGAASGGRIPNSKSIDWAEAINHNGDMKLKSIKELKNIYKDYGLVNDTIITYCHSGVRSAHTNFVLTQLLGYKNVKNYDGSWVEWSYLNNLPIEQDSITTLKK